MKESFRPKKGLSLEKYPPPSHEVYDIQHKGTNEIDDVRPPLGHQMPEIDDVDVQDRKRKISAQVKTERSKRKAKKAGRRERTESTEPSFASLDATPEQLTEKFGEPGYVGNIPFWPLEKGRGAIVFDTLNANDKEQQARGYRIGHAGIHRFPDGWAQYNADEKEFVLLSKEDREELKKELKDEMVEHWGEHGEKRKPKEEKPKLEESSAPVELVPLKTRKDFVEKFGEPDPNNTVDGVSFWIMPDGAAALPGEQGGGGQRIGKNGFVRIGESRYQFDGKAFTKVSNEKTTERDTSKAERAEQHENKAIVRANEVFTSSYAPERRAALSNAYTSAIQDLSENDLKKFRTSIEKRFRSELPEALLQAILDYAEKKVRNNKVIPRVGKTRVSR